MKFEPTFAEPKAPAAVPWGKPPPAPWKPPAPNSRPALPANLPKRAPIDLTKTPKPDFKPNGAPNALPKPAPGNLAKPRGAPLTPTSAGPKLPNFRAIGRRAAWEIVNAGPNADGTIPDFNKTLPKPTNNPQPLPTPDLSGQPCISGQNFGVPPGTNGFLIQYELWRTDGDQGSENSQTGFNPITPGWSQSLGFFNQIYIPEQYNGVSPRTTSLTRHGVKSKQSYISTSGVPSVKYTMYKQSYGVLGSDGSSWEGEYAYSEIYVTKDFDPGADHYAQYPLWTWPYERGTDYHQILTARIPFCDETEWPDPIEDDDYDRNEDEDDMACKWKPANDPRVESLEMIDFEVEEFKGCLYRFDGEEDFFETKTVQFPRGIGEMMVEMYNRQSLIQSQFCKLPVPPMVIPDWMPLKWGNVEKLVVLYAVEKNGKKGPAKYSITIPHWYRPKSQCTLDMFPPYTKGAWNLIMEHSDGSRVTLNADSKQSAEALMLHYRNLLDDPWRYTAIENAGIRRGKAVQENYVVPTEIRFFKAGTNEIKAEWTKKF